MKRIFLLPITLLTFSVTIAQDFNDAIRFAQDNLHGTARFRAMGGAFGALGGDLSSINVNPAGSAVFANNQMAVTFNNTGIRNQATYFGETNSTHRNIFDLNQAGAVFVFNNIYNPQSQWKKLTFAINYDNIDNFRNNIFFSGINPSQSLANYFLGFAQGTPLDLLETMPGESLTDLYAFLAGVPGGFGAQQAFLGYQSFLINPVNFTPNNTEYTANTFGGNYRHTNGHSASGYNGKLTFNLGGQYEDWLYLGANLNAHFIDYRQGTTFREDMTNSGGQGVERAFFNNDLRTFGNGFSMNFGAIARFTPEWRMGLSYETPTWIRMVDQLTQSVFSTCTTCGAPSSTIAVNPMVTIEYPSYRLRTPGRWTGSLAYIIGGKGLISADLAIKDYRNTAFGPVDDFFAPVNRQMSDIFAMSAELRLGGEYRIDRWSLRGGYRYEQSPFRDALVIGDLSSWSTGVGYNFGSTRLDLAYTFMQREFDLQPLATEFQPSGNFAGFNSRARVMNRMSMVTVSLVFEL